LTGPRPAAALAEKLALKSVDFVESKLGIRLPFTPESLLVIDAFVDTVRRSGVTERQAQGVLQGLGCYVGEVFVRHARGSWQLSAEMPSGRDSGASTWVVALPDLVTCDVIAAVFQRFRDEGSSSVAALYERHCLHD